MVPGGIVASTLVCKEGPARFYDVPQDMKRPLTLASRPSRRCGWPACGAALKMTARSESTAMDELYVRVKGGGEICVSTEHSVTTYVLIEQEDWFEREIAFVRRLLQPGMRVIDIGANYGTYTLTMAQ